MLQREIARNLMVEAAYVGNRGVWWTAPLLAQENYNALTPEGLLAERMYGDTTGIDVTKASDRALLTLPISNPLVLARFPALKNPDVVYKGFPNTQLLNQALRPHPQWLDVLPILGPPLGVTWFDSLQVKAIRRFSHNLDFQTAFTWQKELTLGAKSAAHQRRFRSLEQQADFFHEPAVRACSCVQLHNAQIRVLKQGTQDFVSGYARLDAWWNPSLPERRTDSHSRIQQSASRAIGARAGERYRLVWRGHYFLEPESRSAGAQCRSELPLL
jgi:hypothetical protein